MNRPLSHYFISSGHNSYLTGNQLTSKSDTSTITYCLEKGCRVIELDVYDGSSEPVVTHGGTLTTSVTFRECIKAVKAAAFKASPYPVIITIENHASAKGQEIMADILHKVLGNSLMVPTQEQLEATEWPSPASLKHKVIIRGKVVAGKTAPAFVDVVFIRNSKLQSYSDPCLNSKNSHSLTESKLPSPPEYEDYKTTFGVTLVSEGQQAGGEGGAAGAEAVEAAARAERREEEEEEQEDATATVTPGGAEPNKKTPPLSDVLRYNSRHLLRAYPSAWRMLDNSNYNPATAWSLGVSIAALNWQLRGYPLWINQGLFGANGQCGYLLKPEWMTTKIPSTGLPDRPPRKLKVTVHSAHKRQGRKFAMFRDDIYVKLEVHGVPCDEREQRTPHADNSGQLVVDETYEFDVRFPEMAVLIVLLKDEETLEVSNDVHGYACLPLSDLQEGDWRLPLQHPKRDEHKKVMWVKLGLRWDDGAGGHEGGDAGRSKDAKAKAEKSKAVESEAKGPDAKGPDVASAQ